MEELNLFLNLKFTYKTTKEKFALLDLSVSPETVARRCSVKKLFLKISQNSRARVSFLIKLQASGKRMGSS